MPAIKLLRRAVQALLIALTLLAIFCWIVILRAGLVIDTDLKSLSPEFEQTSVVNDALNRVAENAGNQITLVLASTDEEELEEANEALFAHLDAANGALLEIDQTELLNRYIESVTPYQFQMLTPSGRQLISESSDEELLTKAKRDLYSQSSALRLTPLSQDPFTYFNDFLLDTLNNISTSSNGNNRTTIEGAERYYSAHLLKFTNDALDMRNQAQTIHLLSDIKRQLQQQFPSLIFLQSGMIFFAADAASNAKADIGFISSASGLGVLFLMLLVFRRPTALVLPLISIASGCAFAFALCHMYFQSVHILTIVFGASLIGVVIDYSLHFFYLFTPNKTDAQRHLYRALFFSLLTSVIGYGALSLSGLSALQQIAFFSALGLIYACLVVVCIGPMVSANPTIHDRFLRQGIGWLVVGLSKVRTLLLCSILFLVFAGLLFTSEWPIPSVDSPKVFFQANTQLLAEEQHTRQLSSHYEPASFILISGESEEAVYASIASLEAGTAAREKKWLGIHSLLPSPSAQAENYSTNQRLYGQNGLLAQFTKSNNLEEIAVTRLREQYLAGAQKTLNAQNLMTQLSRDLPPLWAQTNEQFYAFLLIPAGSDFTELQRDISGLPNVTLVSAVKETSKALKHLRHSALTLLGLALALIALLTVMRFGWHLGLKVMFIPVGAIGFTLLLLSVFSIPLTLFHSMALFLVLGLGMDYVIFTVEIPERFERTLAAIVLSAVTSLMSFGLLSLSQLPAVSAFGITVLIGNSLNLAGCILLTSRLTQSRSGQPAFTPKKG